MDGSLLAPLMNSSKDNLPAESRTKQGSASAAAVTGDDGVSHSRCWRETLACPGMEQVFKKEEEKHERERVVGKKDQQETLLGN